MPLSEEEMRLLEQMERALEAEDPKFVSTLQGRTIGHAVKMRAIAAAAVFIVGVSLLLGGAMARATWLGIIGFVVMLVSATVGLAAWHGRNGAGAAKEAGDTLGFPAAGEDGFRVIEGGRSRARKPSTRPRPSNSSGFMQRMERRWQDRRNQG